MSEQEQSMAAEVGREAVYAQMYNEMRRFRDYEFSSSKWYTALLLTILGFLVAVRFGGTAPAFAALLNTLCWLKVAVLLGAVLIAATSSYLIYYSYRRYRLLRSWTDDLEPKWKMATFPEDKILFGPRHIYYLTPWLLVVLICIVLFITRPIGPSSGTVDGSPVDQRRPMGRSSEAPSNTPMHLPAGTLR